MKRGWIALIFLLIAAGVSTGESLYINTNTAVCLDMLSEADAYMAHNEVSMAQSVIGRLNTRFGNDAWVYDIFLFHSEISQVSGELEAMKSYARTGDVAEFLASSGRVRNALESMRSTRELRAENVL